MTRPNDPHRESLRPIRRGLLRLHKALIDHERAEYERVHGALSSTAFLQALLQNEHFAWLRGFSELIVQIDEAIADRERDFSEADMRLFLGQALGLLAPPGEPATEGATRLQQARERDAAIRMIDGELARQMAEIYERMGSE